MIEKRKPIDVQMVNVGFMYSRKDNARIGVAIYLGSEDGEQYEFCLNDQISEKVGIEILAHSLADAETHEEVGNAREDLNTRLAGLLSKSLTPP